jgi:16S rRNA (adenine1518-N6/adenine1519-N6)-dimethyltransferase
MLDRSSPSAIRRLIHDLGTFPRKKWGQNFLIDHNIIARIVASSQLDKEDFVVEIGPGLGGLTQELARECKGVLAIEIDRRLEPALEELELENPNLRIIYADVLTTDVEAELVKAFGPEAALGYQVCANIPYNITTPIIFKLLEECPHCQKITVMIQQEVGDRLAAAPGSKDYGRLSLAVAYYADTHPIIKVSRNCFYPRPEVDSTVIRLVRQTPKKVEVIDEPMFKKFLNGAFQKRRKTILNITAAFFQQNKEETQLYLAELGIDPHLRPEDLTLKDMAGIVNRFTPDIDT